MLSRNALRASLLFYAVKASIKAIKKPLRLQKYNKNLIYANHLQKKLRSAWATPALRLFRAGRRVCDLTQSGERKRRRMARGD